MTPLPAIATLSEFAALLNRKRSYITHLKGEGRLVLTDDGKRVRVAESIARIKATEDPAKRGVAARHAARRAAASEVPKPEPAAAAVEPPAPEIEVLPTDEGFHYWRQRSEKAKALAGERENAVAEGKLMDAGEVATAIGSAVTTLRARLESLPDVLGPQLAALTDEGRVRAALAEAIEHALDECARQFGTLAKQVIT